MAYTVKQLAEISEVSVRTLHFYDEIGLLKPAYHGSNGYRFYEEEQLLVLQQILFFRELGFELKQIQKVLRSGDFDKVATLTSHKKVLQENLKRIRELIMTIDKTIEHLKGTKKMKDQEMYFGFNKEKQLEYQIYLKNRIGEDHPSFAQAEKNVKHWIKTDWENSSTEYNAICLELLKLMQQGFEVSSAEVQIVVRKHYEWIKQYWTPNQESYIGLGEGYKEFEWKKTFEPYDSNHPKFAQFLAEGMRFFAERELLF